MCPQFNGVGKMSSNFGAGGSVVAMTCGYYTGKCYLIDPNKHTVTGEVVVGTNPSRIATNGTVFLTTLTADNKVAVLDSKLNIIKKIDVGAGPSGIAYSPLDKRFCVINGTDGTVSIISGDTLTVTNTFAVAVGIYGAGYGNNRFMITQFSAGPGTHIFPINSTTLAVGASIVSGAGPVAIDYGSGMYAVADYTANDARFYDGTTLAQIGSVPGGSGTGGGVVYGNGEFFFQNPVGNGFIFGSTGFVLSGATVHACGGSCYSPKTKEFITGDFTAGGSLTFINAITNAIVTTVIIPGAQLFGVACTQ